jgi:hypothetical protein
MAMKVTSVTRFVLKTQSMLAIRITPQIFYPSHSFISSKYPQNQMILQESWPMQSSLVVQGTNVHSTSTKGFNVIMGWKSNKISASVMVNG